MGQLRDSEGRFAGWSGTGKKNIPSSQDNVIKKYAVGFTEETRDSVQQANVTATFEKFEELNKNIPSSLRTIDTSRFGEYHPTTESFDNWRAADGLMIRWEPGAFRRDIITAELDIPELDNYYSMQDVRSLIREDKASEATRLLAAHLRRMADELEDQSDNLFFEEQQRTPNEED